MLVFNRAMSGIGILILFISALLISVIASAVVLTTTNDMSISALSIKQSSEYHVASRPLITEVKVYDASDASIEEFIVLLKLPVGSMPIALSEMSVVLNTVNQSVTLNYRATNVCEQGSFGFETNVTGRSYYCADYFLQNSVGHLDDHLSGGELVELHFEPEFAIGEREHVMIKIIPKSAPPTYVEFSTPEMTHLYEFVYPI